jgi:hypothetical protein
VRIPLPGALNSAAKLLKATGQQKKVDELVTAMNRAAEAAVPAAKPLLVNAVKSMSVEDGLKVLRGGDDSATQFFASKTRAPLREQFLPIVTQATEKVSLAEKYNAVAGKAAGMGLLKGDEANIQQYVTGKALDGLFLMIAEEEKKIRKDPVGTGSAILKKVFGGLGKVCKTLPAARSGSQLEFRALFPVGNRRFRPDFGLYQLDFRPR